MLSLVYYERIFNGDLIKLNKIKSLILNDFKKMEHLFFEANSMNNLKLMQIELHKMSPIVSNLKFMELSILFQKYKSLTTYDESIEYLNTELKAHLTTIYSFLN